MGVDRVQIPSLLSMAVQTSVLGPIRSYCYLRSTQGIFTLVYGHLFGNTYVWLLNYWITETFTRTVKLLKFRLLYLSKDNF